MWLSWGRFGIILSFILASTSHHVAIVHPFDAMLRCWDSFWSCYLTILGAFWHHVVLYARVHIPSRGQFARFCYHVALLGFILTS